MSTSSVNQSKQNPIILALYWKNWIALPLHFVINATLSFLFALLFIHIFNKYGVTLNSDTKNWMTRVFLVGSLFVSYQTCIDVPTYRGYLVNFLGLNAHINLTNGWWPLYLYPLIKLDEHEEVDYQVEDIKIAKHLQTDKTGILLESEGVVMWQIPTDGTAAVKFTATVATAFFDYMKIAVSNVSKTVIHENSYAPLDLTAANAKMLIDTKLYNEELLARLDTAYIFEKYGAKVTRCELGINITAEGAQTLAQKANAIQKVEGNKVLGMGYAELVEMYKTKFGFTNDQAIRAANAALNGAEVVDINNNGGGSVPVIKIGKD